VGTPAPAFPAKWVDRFDLFLGTFGFSGYVKFAPGTSGSAAALAVTLPLLWLPIPTQVTLWTLSAVWTLLSVWIGARCIRTYNVSDPSWFVMDEAAGMALALACGPGLGLGAIVGAFGLFRILDVFKPPPIRQIENLKGGVGITFDDVAAGIGAGLILRGAYWAAGLEGSWGGGWWGGLA
jgi:phosphatidylglycerophosphatase A